MTHKRLVEAAIVTAIPVSIIWLELYVLKQSKPSPAILALFIAWIGLVWFLVKNHRLTAKQLGFTESPLAGWKQHVFITAIGVLIALLLAVLLDRHVRTDLFSLPHFQYGFITTAIIQQLIFRGYMLTLLETKYSQKTSIIVGAVLFSFVHIAFDEPWLNIPLTLAIGLVWGHLFFKYRNIYLLIASHAVLNFVFVMFSFISNDNIQF